MAVYDINRILVPDAPPEYEDHTRDVHYVPAPCQVACPIGTDAPSYIAHIWDEDYEGAFEAITSTNPFSSICGRVCDAPCEPACRRVDSDGAVQIRNLKRFVMDKLGATYRPPAAPVTRKQSIGIVGAGPAGLVAAHDLCVAGYAVHVYEMTDRLGGMMIWGIPAFRLPPGIIDEDVDRLMQRCPGLEVHLDTALGRDVSLGELKERHDAVLLTIGAWWGKPMGIPGEEDERVVDGVGFLRRVNAGERPEMPETVVVVGGGDVAMDACRVAKRLPGCKHVKVIYRRGPGEIPAREIELHHAIKEDVEFLYHTQQVAVVPRGNQLALRCVKTGLGEPDDDGRRRPVAIEGSEHEILCGSVIAAVGQRSICEELHRADMMGPDRVRTEWDSMRTSDPMVFAAGDGAFGGSTLVMAMQHGQRAGRSPQAYLLNGERWMNALETLMLAAGGRLYAELAELPPEHLGVGIFMSQNPNAAVMFDGCSLREIPRLLQLAGDSGREVRGVCCGRAALPSDTEAFVGRSPGLGSPRDQPVQAHVAGRAAGAQFPNSTARRWRNERHGDNMKSKVRIDDDLMAELRSRARLEQISVTRALNRVIWTGLAAANRPCEERKRYEEVTVRMGRPRVEIDKALALATALGDAEILRKMSSCQ